MCEGGWRGKRKTLITSLVWDGSVRSVEKWGGIVKSVTRQMSVHSNKQVVIILQC